VSEKQRLRLEAAIARDHGVEKNSLLVVSPAGVVRYRQAKHASRLRAMWIKVDELKRRLK